MMPIKAGQEIEREVVNVQELAFEEPIQWQSPDEYQLVQNGDGLSEESEDAGMMSLRRSAQLKKYPNGVKFNSGKKSYKKRNNKAKQARMEYLQSLDPLDMDQAQLVVKLTGVEIQGRIEEEVAKMAMF